MGKCSDYVENQKLDRYEDADLDEEDYDPMDGDARLAAERRMNRRDRREAKGLPAEARRRRARVPAFLQSESEGSDTEANLLGRRRRRRVYDEVPGEDDVFDEVNF